MTLIAKNSVSIGNHMMSYSIQILRIDLRRTCHLRYIDREINLRIVTREIISALEKTIFDIS
jgi:hypothetical protein